ncbi:hypothetical protein TMatcc_005218 [Talaromyces marneffei ATCC 18224]|uniref:uncharacterized protein n=1 Tax=Talaromyces marneffei TaxID=37727 RepID=UPI0012A93FB3|nr:uncharacterized protein EYB26_006214 [Talaromyces marneffei]QGA18529.1 hypothetical protein EYB26_006214 [Talaromyces marneffei]
MPSTNIIGVKILIDHEHRANQSVGRQADDGTLTVNVNGSMPDRRSGPVRARRLQSRLRRGRQDFSVGKIEIKNHAIRSR